MNETLYRFFCSPSAAMTAGFTLLFLWVLATAKAAGRPMPRNPFEKDEEEE